MILLLLLFFKEIDFKEKVSIYFYGNSSNNMKKFFEASLMHKF